MIHLKLIYFFFQRAFAAICAICDLFVLDRAFALAFPPFNPPKRPKATAAGFRVSSMMGSLVFPVARSTIDFASWFVSLGLLGLFI